MSGLWMLNAFGQVVAMTRKIVLTLFVVPRHNPNRAKSVRPPRASPDPLPAEVTGGPFKFSATKPGKTHLGLEEAHRDLKITPEEFDEVAAELGRSLDFAKVSESEKGEVLTAFAAHKKEVTAGTMQK
jgi:hypothetical protein